MDNNFLIKVKEDKIEYYIPKCAIVVMKNNEIERIIVIDAEKDFDKFLKARETITEKLVSYINDLTRPDIEKMNVTFNATERTSLFSEQKIITLKCKYKFKEEKEEKELEYKYIIYYSTEDCD